MVNASAELRRPVSSGCKCACMIVCSHSTSMSRQREAALLLRRAMIGPLHTRRFDPAAAMSFALRSLRHALPTLALLSLAAFLLTTVARGDPALIALQQDGQEPTLA